MSLEIFHKEILIPKEASIRRGGDSFNIHINLEPFTLDGEVVETAFHLERVRLPANTKAWAKQTFTFPRNPKDGYIDGSIYLRNVHNPADVTSIKFGECHDDSINAEFYIFTWTWNLKVQVFLPKRRYSNYCPIANSCYLIILEFFARNTFTIFRRAPQKTP